MDYIEHTINGRIGIITLNRPEKRNALSFELVSALKEAFTSFENDPRVKIIILNARGQVFCAGADLEYLQKLQRFSHDENLADSNHLKALLLLIYTLKKLVVAQVQGHALAGGCGLVSVCDFVFAVPEAKFGYTEVKIGFIPAVVMTFLLRKIGEARAKQLLLSGDLVQAEEAFRLGIVNKVVNSQDLEKEVMDFALRLSNENSQEAMMVTKQMVAQVQSMPLLDALNYASEMNAKARATEDCKKGIQAFLNKEKIVW